MGRGILWWKGLLEDLEQGDSLQPSCLASPQQSKTPGEGQFAGDRPPSFTLLPGGLFSPTAPQPRPFPVPGTVEGGWRMSELVLPHSL